MKLRPFQLAVAALAGSQVACVLGPEPVFAQHVADGAYCSSPHALDAAEERQPQDATLPAPNATARAYSARVLDTARAIGALAEVERLAEAQARGAPLGDIVDLRGQLNDAIDMATLDLSSTVAHLDCEEGRAGQIASDLRDAEQQQTRRLTAYSLVLSAAAAIGTGVLAITDKDPTPAGVVGISGGAVGGAFGFATLAVHRATTFRHARNILGQVWTGGAHPDLPDIIWAYLTRPQFTPAGDRTRRDYLVQAWKESGRLGPDAQHPSPERVALYFGDGGTYDADGLDDRVDMLSEVREVVDLMSHDLQHLATEAARR
jgi:hypothetical protein